MPAEGMPFRPHEEILRFEEIARMVRVAASCGVRRLRLTGGEPLVRRHVCRLVEMLAGVPGIEDLALTTNGILLDRYAEPLKDVGLSRLNISLDTLDRAKFQRISRRDELPRVLAGIEAARRAGFEKIKLNAIAIRGLSEEDLVPLARFALERGMELRFIEYMPLDGDGRWRPDQVLSADEILRLLARAFGPLEAVVEPDSRAPATRYHLARGAGIVGIVRSVSHPFCETCSRLRLTAEGKVRNCLFATEEWDVRGPMRSGATDQQLADILRRAISAKKQAHGSDDGQFAVSVRTMHQIGG